jgi:hypothetical protein
MRGRHGFSTAILPLVLLGLTAGILSCAPVETGPRVWIDFPLEGSRFFADTTVSVTCHAFSREGVAEVQLAVNGEPYRLASPGEPGEQFVEISTEWLATKPGDYVLSVTAFDMTGAATNPDRVTVTVVGEAPSLILTPTERETTVPPTGTPEEPAATTAPSETPPAPTATSLPPTGTPVPPTAAPPPPRIVSFEVNRSQITVGECIRFSWRVEGYPTAINFDGQGVTSPDSRDSCPTATRDFELRAEGPSGVDAQSITVVVVEPSPTPDTQGPAAPSGLSPSGGEGQGCGAVTLSWNAVSDPSGISTYYVKVEKISGSPKSGGWQTTNTEYTIAASWLECGQVYRWAVRAEDGAGNVGPWSAWAQFSMNIT